MPTTSIVNNTSRFTSYRRQEAVAGWLFSAPALLLIVVFLIVPFLLAIALSFTNQRLVPNPNLPTKFIGARNYARLLDDPVFFQALRNNLYFTIIVIPLQTMLSLLMAILVNKKLKGAILFRTIYFMPVVVSMVVVAISWVLIYNPGAGPLNALIQWISNGALGPYTFLKSTNLVMPAIMLLCIWSAAGMQMVIFLAGLQDIPAVLYEAAEADGANPLQQFFHITLPGLRNTTIFLIMSTTILSFRLFTPMQIMTEGGPDNASMTMVLYAVNRGWKSLQIGYASAVSVIFFLVVLTLSLIQRSLLHSEETRGDMVARRGPSPAQKLCMWIQPSALIVIPRRVGSAITQGIETLYDLTAGAFSRKLSYPMRRKMGGGAAYVVMLFLAFFFCFPVLLMFMSSIKTNELQVVSDLGTMFAFLPRGQIGLQNFRDVFTKAPFTQYVLNSSLIVGITLILGLIVNSLMAYALARLRFKGRKVVLLLIISLIIVPFEGVGIPLLLLVNRLPWFGQTGWVDTYHVQILPFIADALMIFLFYQFFLGFPRDLEEAAIVDGANVLQIFYNIVLPNSKPVFATVTILTFITRWNDYLWPLLVTRGPQVRPLMVGYQQFFGLPEKFWGDIMAYGTMVTLPVLLVFIVLQRTFVQSVASTGIKG